MRRKTLRWVSLAALALAAAVFVTGALGASGQKGALDGKKVGVIICTEPEPVLRGLGEHGQERPREAGRRGHRPQLGVRSRGRRPEHEPPDRGQAGPDHLGARERVRDRAVLHPREGGGHPDPRRDRPPVGRGREDRHRRGAHRRSGAREVRRDEPRRGHDEGGLHEGQRDRPHRHRQPEQRHRPHGGVQGVHEEVPAVQGRRDRGHQLGSGDVGEGRAAAALEVRLQGRHPGRLRHGRQHGGRDHPGRQAGGREDRRGARRASSSPAATASPSASTRSSRASSTGPATQAPQVEAALAVKVGGRDPERQDAEPKVQYVQEQRITEANVAKFSKVCTF